ncbi:hypothetical protein U1Q18_009801 [Sarracenia purpurea var. burkii]
MVVAAVLEVAPEDAEQATQVEEEKSEAEEDPIDMLAGNFYSPSVCPKAPPDKAKSSSKKKKKRGISTKEVQDLVSESVEKKKSKSSTAFGRNEGDVTGNKVECECPIPSPEGSRVVDHKGNFDSANAEEKGGNFSRAPQKKGRPLMRTKFRSWALMRKRRLRGGVATDLKVDDLVCSTLGPELGEGSLGMKEESVNQATKLEVAEKSGVKGGVACDLRMKTTCQLDVSGTSSLLVDKSGLSDSREWSKVGWILKEMKWSHAPPCAWTFFWRQLFCGVCF